MGKELLNFAEKSISGLEKSMLGGVKKESAVKAIKNVAEEGDRQIEKLTQTASSQSARITNLSEEVQKAQQELRQATANNSYLKTQLESKEGELAKSTEKLTQTAEDLSKTKSELADAKKTKKGVSKLEDGSTQEIKVNKNGTSMRKITAKNGNLKSVEVEQVDGSKRLTEFDTTSGKRVSTKTNSTGEEVNIDYDLQGKTAKIATNAEPKPTLVKKSKEGNKIIEEFSDGSKTIRIQEGKVGAIEKYNKDGKLLEQYREDFDAWDRKRTYHVFHEDKDTVVTSTVNEGKFINQKTISTDEFGNKFVSEAKFITPKSETVYKPTKTDMLGNITESEAHITYKNPKTNTDLVSTPQIL